MKQSDAATPFERLADRQHINYLIEAVTLSSLGEEDQQDLHALLRWHRSRAARAVEAVAASIRDYKGEPPRANPNSFSD